jgi:hypothetical protein
MASRRSRAFLTYLYRLILVPYPKNHFFTQNGPKEVIARVELRSKFFPSIKWSGRWAYSTCALKGRPVQEDVKRNLSDHRRVYVTFGFFIAPSNLGYDLIRQTAPLPSTFTR